MNIIIQQTMLQRIEIIGNLVQDAEVKTGKDGKEFVTFRVAVSEGTGDDRKVTYYDITYVKNGLLPYLRKGQSIYVSGRLSIGAVCKDGKAYVNAYVNGRDVDLLGSPRND